jgi:hypothetical protein
MRVILSGAKDPTYDAWIAHVWKRGQQSRCGVPLRLRDSG